MEEQGRAVARVRTEQRGHRMLKKGLCHGNLRRDLDPREAFAKAAALDPSLAQQVKQQG